MNNLARNGVVCSISLLILNNGKVRIVLDDVIKSKNTNNDTWDHSNFFTFRDFDLEAFEKLDLSESEFADFGHSILARLISTSEYASNLK